MRETRSTRYGRKAVLASAIVFIICPGSSAQTAHSVQPQPLPTGECTAPCKKKKDLSQNSATFRSWAWGARIETEPPGYVRTLNEFEVTGMENLDWLEFGLEHCTRFELRSDYRRPDLADDEQFLLRSRLYLGVRDVLDPFRFAVEFQDSRQFYSDFPERDRDVDEADFIQAFAELYFEDALGKDCPLQLRAGRMSLEYIDRRLVARNRWRNTTNAFDGFRLRLGQPMADWQLDVFVVQPVERRMISPDRPDEERWFYGVTGAWRGWSQHIMLEPYYFVLDEDRKDRDDPDREIHTVGLHAFGPIRGTQFDYDIDMAFQFGDDGERRQRAFAVYGEVGHTFYHAWRPRLSASFAYASGDRDPDDGLSERFDRLFQATHCPSTSDLFSWQNIISPKIRLTLRPTSKLRLDTSYGAYWLASDNDAWGIPARRNPHGDSGNFVGHEVEVRVRYQIGPRVELETGYSHFFPGAFFRNTGPADDGDCFYVQTTVRL
ncbi:MAG: alginate export family protein [Phycisphaerales bacterium]|nr:MAG: alginate export family protein [Phycisphaerales bacterium]